MKAAIQNRGMTQKEAAEREVVFADPKFPICSPTTEAEELAEHCRANNITHHSINADGSCNMGCC